MQCTCDNCDWTGEPDNELWKTSDLAYRLEPGSTVPAGECPSCGCLAYPVVPTAWTVLLAHPDGQGTYLAQVEAPDADEALDLARKNAAASNLWASCAPADYPCLLLIAGKHDDLNPES